jgi:hypothetical protein
LFAVCLFVCSFESFKNLGIPLEKKMEPSSLTTVELFSHRPVVKPSSRQAIQPSSSRPAVKLSSYQAFDKPSSCSAVI